MYSCPPINLDHLTKTLEYTKLPLIDIQLNIQSLKLAVTARNLQTYKAVLASGGILGPEAKVAVGVPRLFNDIKDIMSGSGESLLERVADGATTFFRGTIEGPPEQADVSPRGGPGPKGSALARRPSAEAPRSSVVSFSSAIASITEKAQQAVKNLNNTSADVREKLEANYKIFKENENAADAKLYGFVEVLNQSTHARTAADTVQNFSANITERFLTFFGKGKSAENPMTPMDQPPPFSEVPQTALTDGAAPTLQNETESDDDQGILEEIDDDFDGPDFDDSDDEDEDEDDDEDEDEGEDDDSANKLKLDLEIYE